MRSPVLQLCFVNWPDIGAEVNDKARLLLAFLCLLGRLRATSPLCGSKERQGQLEQFEPDESGPCGAGDEADWNGRDNKHVPHDLHPEKREGALVRCDRVLSAGLRGRSSLIQVPGAVAPRTCRKGHGLGGGVGKTSAGRSQRDRQKIDKMVAKQGGCVARRLITIWPSGHF